MKDRDGLHMCSTGGRVCKEAPKIDIYNDEMEDHISGHLIVWPYRVNRRSSAICPGIFEETFEKIVGRNPKMSRKTFEEMLNGLEGTRE